MRYTTGGVDLLETQFGMGMQITAKRCQLGMKLRNLGKRTAVGTQGRLYVQRPRRSGSGIRRRLQRVDGLGIKASQCAHGQILRMEQNEVGYSSRASPQGSAQGSSKNKAAMNPWCKPFAPLCATDMMPSWDT